MRCRLKIGDLEQYLAAHMAVLDAPMRLAGLFERQHFDLRRAEPALAEQPNDGAQLRTGALPVAHGRDDADSAALCFDLIELRLVLDQGADRADGAAMLRHLDAVGQRALAGC